MAIHYPPVFINQYLQDKLPHDDFDNALPFFPTKPSSIDELTQEFPEGMFAVYDRMFRFRRSPFPHIKTEQIIYYFYKMTEGPERLIETIQYVHDLLDRGDESAQEINNWISGKWRDQGQQTSVGRNIVSGIEEEYRVVSFGSGIDQVDFLLPFFHEIKIFQLEEARDIIDFGTARTYAGNKLIINYDWHESSPIK